MTVAFAPYSNYGYLALRMESAVATPLTPNQYFRYLTESLMADFGVEDINEIAGSRDRYVRSIQGIVEMSGDIEFYLEEKIAGYFLTGLYGAADTDEVATGIYRHVFRVQDTDKTMTIDVNPGNAPWVHRFYGVHVSGMEISKDGNGVKCKVSTMPTRAFIVAKVTTAASSGTSLVLDQVEGLTTADTILVLDKADGVTVLATLTISAVTAATLTLTVSTIGVQLDVDDLVVIKRADITDADYEDCTPFQFSNGTEVYTGADIDNTVADPQEDMTLKLGAELDPRPMSGRTQLARFPAEVLLKGITHEGSFTRYYNSESNLSKLRSNTKIGVRVLMEGLTALAANSAVKAGLTYGATANGFSVEAATAGKAGADLNLTIVINSTDDLAAAKSGNNITLSLANTTASKNTGTLIAAALDALTGVDAAAEGTGAEEFTAAVANTNFGFKNDADDVPGADANQKPYLQFDFADAKLQPFMPSTSEDENIPEEKEMKFYKDVTKGFSARVVLVNTIASY